MINFIIPSSIIVQNSSRWQVQSFRHFGTNGVQTQSNTFFALMQQQLCLYLRAAKPLKLKNYLFSHIGANHEYEDAEVLREELNDLCDHAILPVNHLLIQLLAPPTLDRPALPTFKFAISVDRYLLDDLLELRPDVIKSYADLLATKQVELVADPGFSALALFCAPEQLVPQVDAHLHKLQAHFALAPVCCSAVGALLTPDLARSLGQMGFRTLLADLPAGVSHTWQSVGFSTDLSLIYGNRDLMAVFADHFDNSASPLYPFTAAKFLKQVMQPANLFFDYNTFGVTYSEDTGIFGFLEELVQDIGRSTHFSTILPTELEAVQLPNASGHSAALAVANNEYHTLTENKLQKEVLEKIRSLKERVTDQDEYLRVIWLRLLDISLFRAMRLGQPTSRPKEWSPYDVYINCMNILSDMEKRFVPNDKSKPRVFSALRAKSREMIQPLPLPISV